MTKVIPLHKKDNETENTLMIYTCQCYYYNQIIIQKSDLENTYQFQIILNDTLHILIILRLHNVSKVLP